MSILIPHPEPTTDPQSCPTKSARPRRDQEFEKRSVLQDRSGILDDQTWVHSDLGSLREFEGVLHVHAKIAHRALDLGVAEQDLNGAEIACCFVDDRRLGAPERVRSVLLRLEADADHPLVHQAGVLARAHVRHVVVSARENVVVERAAAALQPSSHRFPGSLHQLELDGSLRLLLHDYCASAHAPTRNDIANADLDLVATAQLAIDSEVEQRSVA